MSQTGHLGFGSFSIYTSPCPDMHFIDFRPFQLATLLLLEADRLLPVRRPMMRAYEGSNG